jgi:hypothetical protein
MAQQNNMFRAIIALILEQERRINMNIIKKAFEVLKENYMEYVDMMYGPFDR